MTAEAILLIGAIGYGVLGLLLLVRIVRGPTAAAPQTRWIF